MSLIDSFIWRKLYLLIIHTEYLRYYVEVTTSNWKHCIDDRLILYNVWSLHVTSIYGIRWLLTRVTFVSYSLTSCKITVALTYFPWKLRHDLKIRTHWPGSELLVLPLLGVTFGDHLLRSQFMFINRVYISLIYKTRSSLHIST